MKQFELTANRKGVAMMRRELIDRLYKFKHEVIAHVERLEAIKEYPGSPCGDSHEHITDTAYICRMKYELVLVDELIGLALAEPAKES